jgi:Uma2 family endonuclease
LGVQRFIDEDLRLSYVLWEENVVPTFVLEVVSQKYRGEYSTKQEMYANLGVVY